MMPNADLVVQTEQLSKVFRVGFWGKASDRGGRRSIWKFDVGKCLVFSARTARGKPLHSRC